MPEEAEAANGSPSRWHRPKTQLFRALAVLWCFPSLGAIAILAFHRAAWSESASIVTALEATRFEQWIALGILLAHAVFLFLARHYHRAEKPVALPPEDEGEPEDKKIQ